MVYFNGQLVYNSNVTMVYGIYGIYNELVTGANLPSGYVKIAIENGHL